MFSHLDAGCEVASMLIANWREPSGGGAEALALPWRAAWALLQFNALHTGLHVNDIK